MAIELYSVRSRIEIMFNTLKKLICAFQFHFWTKKLPRHSRRPVANRYLKVPTENGHISIVQSCWQA